MTNYEAMKKMDIFQLAEVLVEIYFTGVNNGQYASTAETEEEAQKRFFIVEDNPFDSNWLFSEADKMLTETLKNDNKDEYYTANYCESLFRITGINPNEQ
jgi:hypothetical protein